MKHVLFILFMLLGTEARAERVNELMNKRTNEAYRALAKWVNALALVGSGDDYDGFITRINSMIKHFKDKAMR